ncbi:MAG: CoA transferase [Chloroflexota bacterium]
MAKLPFEGYRVVDFGWVWAGTVLGHILADHGAEVIKIESKKRLDGLRLGRVFELGDTLEVNPAFHNNNRSKMSITLDWTTPRGHELILELIRKSDIVNENFGVGTLKRHGLDYDSLVKIKPDIIMLSLSPAGQYGPLSEMLAYAPLLSALAGIDSMLGYRDDRPLGFKHAYADVVATLYGAFTVMAALRYRERTGQGQYIDLSQSEVTTSLIGEAMMDYFMNGRVAGCQGNLRPHMAPHGNYRCKGDDKWVSIAVKTEDEWQAFCTAIGNPTWTGDPKFSDLSHRLGNLDELDKHVTEWTLTHTDYEAAELLQKAGVAAAPVLNIEGVFFDPHFQERGIFLNVDHPIAGGLTLYDLPWQASGLGRKPPRYAPLLGEQNDYVFGQLLGLSKEEIARLVEEKIIY